MDDRWQALFRMIECGHQIVDPLERKIDLARMKIEKSLQNGARTIHYFLPAAGLGAYRLRFIGFQ